MRVIRKSTFLIPIILVLGLLISGCSNKDPLIAIWKSVDAPITIQFKDDGTAAISNDKTTISLPYELQDPDIVLIKASTIGNIDDQTLHYKIEEDQLTLTLDGINSVFTKIK